MKGKKISKHLLDDSLRHEIENKSNEGHTHHNLDILDQIDYTGAETTVDLIKMEENEHQINQLKQNKADQSELNAHKENQTIHVTQTDKDNWNNKSEFSGRYEDLENIPNEFPPENHTHDYNDLTNKPSLDNFVHLGDFSSYQFGNRPYVSTVSKTYYLDQANGSDENDGESPETAFQSWDKVYSKIPIFIHHSHTVKIIGDYAGQIRLFNIHAHESEFILEGNEEDAEQNTITHNAPNIFIRNATNVIVRQLLIKSPNTSNALRMDNSATIDISSCVFEHVDTGDSTGFPLIWIVNCLARVVNCSFSGNENGFGGIYASDPSIVTSQNNFGVAGRYGLYARRGSVIAKSGSQPTGTNTDEGTAFGGVIR